MKHREDPRTPQLNSEPEPQAQPERRSTRDWLSSLADPELTGTCRELRDMCRVVSRRTEDERWIRMGAVLGAAIEKAEERAKLTALFKAARVRSGPRAVRSDTNDGEDL